VYDATASSNVTKGRPARRRAPGSHDRQAALGDGKLFASSQTSHDTDMVIREFVTRDEGAAATLQRWMTREPSPVLRVNSAGVLAKVRRADPGPCLPQAGTTKPGAVSRNRRRAVARSEGQPSGGSKSSGDAA
jgi:hypothetical protein